MLNCYNISYFCFYILKNTFQYKKMFVNYFPGNNFGSCYIKLLVIVFFYVSRET